MSKLDQIRSYLTQEKANIAVFSDPVTVNYLTGFFCDPHERQMFLFVYSDREPVLFVPALEVARASAILNFPVFGYVDSENPWEKIKNGLPSVDSAKILAEFDNLNVTKFQGLQTVFDGRFEDLTPFVQKMRLIKSQDEIDKMMIAGEYADKAVKVGFDNISLNNTETDIIAMIEFEMKKQGVEKMSFETMVLTGDNAANPHGIPGTNKIENNALLLFDLGTDMHGYASDMTRTVAVGKPDQFKKDIYNLCLEAHMAALDFIKPGVTASEVDAAARKVIEKAGYGEYFNHRLGHGIGMTCHEFLQSWKVTTWKSKKVCASQLNLVFTFLEKLVSASKIVVTSQNQASKSSHTHQKNCCTLKDNHKKRQALMACFLMSSIS